MTFRTTFRETCRSRQISLIAFFWEKQARRNKHSNPGLPVVGKVNWNLAPPGFRLDANQPRNLSLFHEKLRAPLDNQRFLRREASLPGLENSHSVELTIARDLRPLLPRQAWLDSEAEAFSRAVAGRTRACPHLSQARANSVRAEETAQGSPRRSRTQASSALSKKPRSNGLGAVGVHLADVVQFAE